MRKLSIVLLVGLMLVAGLTVGVGYAQESKDGDIGSGTTGDIVSTSTTTANLTVKQIAAIYVSDASVNLGNLSANNYDFSGGTGTWTPLESDAFTVAAYSNASNGFAVNVTASWSGSYSQDISDLKISGAELTGESGRSWSGLSSSNTELFKGSSNTVETYDDVKLKYVPDKDDKPGSYTANVTYTVATQ